MPESVKGGLPVLAVDLGGSKMLIATVSDGQITARDRLSTLADEGPQKVVDRLLTGVDRFLSQNKIEPSGLDSMVIAAAGAMDSDRGVITLSPNLPGWHDVPLGDMIRQRFGVKTFLINDANAAAVGEYRCGAGRGTNNLVLLTVGTGIGGGIIIDGKLYAGSKGSAGELGHMTIDVNGPKCACGNIGCLEMLASGKAMARDAIVRIKQGGKTSLVGLVQGKIDNITAKEIGVAAQGGDPLALDVVRRAAAYLGVGLVNLVNIFNPDMIVVGGGVAKMGELLLQPGRQMVAERAFPVAAKAVRIVTAQLGNEAGVIGAAVFAREQESRRT